MRRVGIRRRLLLTVIAGVVLALVALLVGFNLILDRTLDHDATNVARSRAASVLATLSVENGRLSLTEAPDSGIPDVYAWVFVGRHALESPPASPAIGRAARSLTSGPPRMLDVPGAGTRLYGAPVFDGHQRIGSVVAGVSLAPYDRTRRVALIASLVLGGVVLLGVALVAYWLLGASLRPVVRMTRQAAAWSDRDLDRRFEAGEPRDELGELASTLDGLLDRLAASLRREQRFSAELSHELRTPLARVVAEAELALQHERDGEEYRHALEQISRNAAQLTRTVDALVAAARHEAGFERGTADAYALAVEAVAVCHGAAAEHHIELDVTEPAAPLRVAVEPELGERILQPVLENACRYGSSRVSVSIERRDRVVRYTVDDDGPGVAPHERERIFDPGVRGDAGSQDGAGAGLGLALARRLARGASGEVEAVTREDGGRFVITLPAV